MKMKEALYSSYPFYILEKLRRNIKVKDILKVSSHKFIEFLYKYYGNYIYHWIFIFANYLPTTTDLPVNNLDIQ